MRQTLSCKLVQTVEFEAVTYFLASNPGDVHRCHYIGLLLHCRKGAFWIRLYRSSTRPSSFCSSYILDLYGIDFCESAGASRSSSAADWRMWLKKDRFEILDGLLYQELRVVRTIIGLGGW